MSRNIQYDRVFGTRLKRPLPLKKSNAWHHQIRLDMMGSLAIIASHTSPSQKKCDSWYLEEYFRSKVKQHKKYYVYFLLCAVKFANYWRTWAVKRNFYQKKKTTGSINDFFRFYWAWIRIIIPKIWTKSVCCFSYYTYFYNPEDTQ